MASSSLTFDIVGKDAGASKALKGVGERAGKLGKTLRGIGKIGAGAFAGIAASNIAGKLADIASTAVNAFGDAAGATLKLQRYTGDSAESMSRLAHVAAMTGVDTDQLGRGLGFLSKNLVGNSDAAKQLGVAYRDAHGQIIPMDSLLPQISDKFNSMPNGPEKTALMLKLFGKAGMELAPMLNKGGEAMAAMGAESDKLGTTLSGADLDAAKQSTEGKRKLSEAVKGLEISFGKVLAPVIADVTKFLSDSLIPAVRDVTKWMGDHKDLVMVVAGVLGGLGGTVLVIVEAIKVWTAAQAAFNVVMAMNPIVAIGIAIAALVAGIIWAYNNVDWFREGVQTAFGWISTAWGWILDAGKAVWEWISSAWGKITEWLSGPIGTAWNLIKGYYTFMWNAAMSVWDWIKNAWAKVSEWISGPISFAVNLVKGYFATVFGIVGNVVRWVKEHWEQIKDAIWKPIQIAIGIVTGVFNRVRDIVTGVVGWVSDHWHTLQVAITQAIQIAVGFVKDAFNNVKGKVESVVNWITDKWNGIVGFFSGAKDKITETAKGMWDGITGAFKTAINFIIRAWNGLQFDVPAIHIPGTDIGFDAFTIGLPHIPELAAGGIVTGPTLALIGEAGPEAVVPLNRYQGGGGGDTITINVSGAGDPRQTAIEVERVLARRQRTTGRKLAFR